MTEPAMAQRLVRAKRKIKPARIPYRVHEAPESPDRLRSALTNVRRRTAATEVTVTLSYVDKGVVIQDNGAGIDDDTPRAGVRMVGMRERIDGLGGTLAVESAPGEGTTVAASDPGGPMTSCHLRWPPSCSPASAATTALGFLAASWTC